MSGSYFSTIVLLKWTAIPDNQRKYFLISLFLAIVAFVFLMVNVFMGKTGFPEFTPYLFGAFGLCAIATVGTAQYFKAAFDIIQRMDGTRSLVVRERFKTNEYFWPMNHEVFYYLDAVYTGWTVREAPVLLLHLNNERGECILRFREELGYLYKPPVGWQKVDVRSGQVVPNGAKSYSSIGLRLLNLEKLKEQLDRLAVAFNSDRP